MTDTKAKFITPPVWKTDSMNYTDYKFEVELWQKFTKAEVKSQGFAVYSSLPHENDAHDRVRLAIQNKEIDLDNDTAVASIFKTLDKYYKKDDISSVFEAWTSFKVFSRGQNETIQQFLNNYDQQINELKKQNIVLPQVVLALQLLDCAKLEKKETQIVMTAVDYTKKETLYEQMKTALNKFLGEQCLSIGQTMNVKQSRFSLPILRLKTKKCTSQEIPEVQEVDIGDREVQGMLIVMVKDREVIDGQLEARLTLEEVVSGHRQVVEADAIQKMIRDST